ncbi:hypothetical protein [Micromonospora sp. NPDC093277]|uniref:hypothetical protein n=1 Tax=Micromonospora sp. NPDC093277 TaxID=3364291 RepID=UPI0038146566
MTRQQFGFLAGFLLVAVLALGGIGAAAAAALAGLVGWLLIRVVDGDVTASGFADRIGRNSASAPLGGVPDRTRAAGADRHR